MKPRIRLRHGIWYCGVASFETGVIYPPYGHGYTPRAAYDEWLAALESHRPLIDNSGKKSGTHFMVLKPEVSA